MSQSNRSRDIILNKLRAARRPFPDAPPKPRDYMPVTGIDAQSPDELLAVYQKVATAGLIQVHVVEGDDAANEKIVSLMGEKGIQHVLAWHFTQIPVKGIKGALSDAGIKVSQPDVMDEFRMETLEDIREAEGGLTGVDAIAATTATLVVSTGKGRGRIPTVLPKIHIAVATLDQLVGRIEDWVASQRANNLETIRTSANIAFISGPSMTGDIEMLKVLGVHGPGELIVVIKR